jgi:hypothetical protein
VLSFSSLLPRKETFSPSCRPHRPQATFPKEYRFLRAAANLPELLFQKSSAFSVPPPTPPSYFSRKLPLSLRAAANFSENALLCAATKAPELLLFQKVVLSPCRRQHPRATFPKKYRFLRAAANFSKNVLPELLFQKSTAFSVPPPTFPKSTSPCRRQRPRAASNLFAMETLGTACTCRHTKRLALLSTFVTRNPRKEEACL